MGPCNRPGMDSGRASLKGGIQAAGLTTAAFAGAGGAAYNPSRKKAPGQSTLCPGAWNGDGGAPGQGPGRVVPAA